MHPLALAARRVLRQVRDHAMFVVDPAGRVASWNEGVGLILGWDEADWVGQPVGVAFTSEDIAAGVPEQEMRKAARDGRADDTRRMRRRSGEHFFALGAMTRIQDEQGVLLGYLKMFSDRTSFQLAEAEREKLLTSESQARAWAENQAGVLTAAIDAIADGVCIGDAHSIRRSNRAALTLLGAATPDEVSDTAELVLRFRLRRDRDGPLLPVADLPCALASAGQASATELWATRRDSGRDVWLRWAAAPIVVDGRVDGSVSVLSDLSQRLQLDQTGRDLSRVATVLSERDAELRALAGGVRDYAIFTLTPNGRISSWQAGAALMMGYSAEEAIGMEFAALFTPEDRARGRPAHEMVVAARDGSYQGDGERLRKDGSRFEAAVVLTALRDANGELRGFIKLTQDISQRKRQERELADALRGAEQARAQAERASHSKGEFLATISHELRTPLSAILGWAHVLERGVSDAETVKHGLAAISRNARVQVQLIEDLLDMNRIEAGQLRLDLQRVELSGVIAAAVDAALPSASVKGIGLRTVFGPAVGVVTGDAARLQQVIGNLLNNAIKFTPSGGQVSVALTQSGDTVQVAVADTGQGIEADFVARLFDRFQQQDASTTRRHGGLGLGLSIVRHLVQLHGGSIQAHSAGTGLGSTFTLALPAQAAAAEERAGISHEALRSAPAAPGELEPSRPAGRSAPARAAAPLAAAQAPASQRLRGVKVLLIDDEIDGREVIGRVLDAAGAQVVLAATAAEGLERVAAERPQVILSDIAMPGMDGYEMLRRLRQLPAAQGGRTPAAAFTAYARAEDRQRALDAGYQRHLAKPVQPDVLVQAVSELAQQPA